MKTRYMAAAAVLSAAAGVQAQDISTQIVVDRTIQPTVREVSRPANFNPLVRLPEVKLQPLPQREYLQASQLTVLTPTLTPARYRDSLTVTPYRGYVSLGYLPLADVGASAGYAFDLTASTRLSLWAQFDNQRYKGYDDRRDERYSSTVGTMAAQLTQGLGRLGTLALDLRYSTGKMQLPSYGFDRTIAGGKADTTQYNRRFDQASATLAWHGHTDRLRFFLHATPGYFGYTQNIDWGWYAPDNSQRLRLVGAAETSLEAAGGLETDFGATVAGLNLTTHLAHTLRGVEGEVVGTAPELHYAYVEPEFKNVGVTALNPYIKRQFGAVYARLGVSADVYGGVRGQRLHAAPDVNLSWSPLDKLTLEATATGGSYMNTLERMRQINPAGPAVAVYAPTYVPVDSRLTMTVGPTSGFGMKVFGGWSRANDWLALSHDPALRVIDNEQEYLRGHAGARSTVYNAIDISGWMAGATLSYRWRSYLHMEATAMAAERSRNRGYHRWADRARYVIEAKVEATPVEALTFGAGYELRAGRRAYDIAGQGHINLHNISNLSFNADYAVNDRLNVWARVDNLLNHRYLLQPYTPAQGLRGLVGAAYKF